MQWEENEFLEETGKIRGVWEESGVYSFKILPFRVQMSTFRESSFREESQNVVELRNERIGGGGVGQKQY